MLYIRCSFVILVEPVVANVIVAAASRSSKKIKITNGDDVNNLMSQWNIGPWFVLETNCYFM